MLEGDSLAAVALARHGMRLDDARRRMQQLSSPPSTPAASAEVLAQIQRISESAALLVRLLSDNPEASMRVELLLMDLEVLKSLIHDRS